MILKLVSVTGGWGILCKIALRWLSLDVTDDKSTLVQVMAWCPQATSHYLNQSWSRSLMPYGIPVPQWAKITTTKQNKTICIFFYTVSTVLHINELVQEKRNSIANALELHLSCTNPSTWCHQPNQSTLVNSHLSGMCTWMEKFF